jgi:hypothetical protein
MPSVKWLAIAGVMVAAAGLSAQVTVTGQKLTPQAVAARRAELQNVLDAYIAGDHAVVGRDIPRRLDPVTRSALTGLLNDSRVPWQPARVAFGLEVAVWTYRANSMGDALTFAHIALSMTIARPQAIGSNAIEDRFEVLVHQIVLALLQGSGGNWQTHDEAITTIAPRAAQMALLYPPVKNRFVLARAINASMQCCRFVLSGGSRPKTPVPEPDFALALFQAAADDSALRADALVRAAYLEQVVGRSSQALATLDRAVPLADSTLAYAAALIKGGVFDQLGQPDAAADAYLAAEKIAPNAQVPAIGRAAALQRAGRTDEAVAEAAGARRLPVDGFDPWPVFVRADARFIDQWVRDLRLLLK